MVYHDIAACIAGKDPTTPADLLTKCTNAALFSSTEDGYSERHFGPSDYT